MATATTYSEQADAFEEPRYVQFPCLPDNATCDGKPVLNKYSTFLTKDHDFPGAQVFILANFFSLLLA